MAMQPGQMGQGQAPQGGNPEEAIKGLFDAVGMLRDSIVQSEAVPDEEKQAVDGATNQYLEIVGGVVGAGGQPSQGQGGPVPVEQIQGARPMGPQG